MCCTGEIFKLTVVLFVDDITLYFVCTCITHGHANHEGCKYTSLGNWLHRGGIIHYLALQDVISSLRSWRFIFSLHNYFNFTHLMCYGNMAAIIVRGFLKIILPQRSVSSLVTPKAFCSFPLSWFSREISSQWSTSSDRLVFVCRDSSVRVRSATRFLRRRRFPRNLWSCKGGRNCYLREEAECVQGRWGVRQESKDPLGDEKCSLKKVNCLVRSVKCLPRDVKCLSREVKYLPLGPKVSAGKNCTFYQEM